MLHQKFIQFTEPLSKKLRHRIKVIQISNSAANDICVKYHYLHRARTGGRQLSHGILYDDELLGCIVYASPTFHSKKGLIPPLRQNEVIELARMWLHDYCPKHSESCAIGQSLRRIRSDWEEKYDDVPRAVISFADTEFSHEGTIYKATNFKSCGFAPHARFANAGKRYSRTKESYSCGHYDGKDTDFVAPRINTTKRIYLYLWDELPEITLGDRK